MNNLTTISKAIEIFFISMFFFQRKQIDAITTLQSGFVPGDSTTNQLFDICNTFCKALDERKVDCAGLDCAVLFDVSKHLTELGTKTYYTNLNMQESMVP